MEHSCVYCWDKKQQNSNQKRRLLFKFYMSTKGELLFTLNKTMPPGENTLTKEEKKRSTAWEWIIGKPLLESATHSSRARTTM